jgi:hypothetical protein
LSDQKSNQKNRRAMNPPAGGQVSAMRSAKEKNSVRKKRQLQTGFSFNQPPTSL